MLHNWKSIGETKIVHNLDCVGGRAERCAAVVSVCRSIKNQNQSKVSSVVKIHAAIHDGFLFVWLSERCIRIFCTLYSSPEVGMDGWNPVGSMSPVRLRLLLMVSRLMTTRFRQGWRRFPDGWHKQKRGRGKIERNMVNRRLFTPNERRPPRSLPLSPLFPHNSPCHPTHPLPYDLIDLTDIPPCHRWRQ